MTILEFDTHQGIYRFKVGNFSTESHSHPAVEIIVAIKGSFSISTTNALFDNVTFAVIDANVQHSILANNCQLKILMIEHKNDWLRTTLAQHGVRTENGVFTENARNNRVELLEYLEENSHLSSAADTYDERVIRCLDFLESDTSEYSSMIKVLQAKTCLSESRLSHLFKKDVGISLKKYLAWCRLKKTIEVVLTNHDSLFSASLFCGFYDQAHFSKTFKERLGISPSQVYNSRMLQE